MAWFSRHFLIEYRHPADNSPRLRIWGVLEKNSVGVATSMTCLYYKKEGAVWQLLERRFFRFRQSEISGNKPVLLFMKNSPFGREFFAYAQALGGQISVPVLQFEQVPR